MIAAPAQTTPHEDRLRALEERLLELVEDLHQLREDMSDRQPKTGEEGE